MPDRFTDIDFRKRRRRGHPLRRFLEQHPSLFRNIVVMLVVAGLVYLTVDRLLLHH